MNPLQYAADHQLAEAEAIDLFLHATHAGILTMHWGVVCPMCGDIVKSFASLRHVAANFECRLCHVCMTTNLDECIAVSFDVMDVIRPVRFCTPERLSIQEFLGVCRFPYIGTTEDGRPYREVTASFGRVAAFVEPQASAFVVISVAAGQLRLFDFASEQGVVIPVEGDSVEQLQYVNFDGRETKIVGSVDRLAPGPVSVSVTTGPIRRAIMINNFPSSFVFPKRVPARFLTGKRLFANQTFRELFRSEKIESSEGLQIKDLTIVFTDLKGSTALYERVGDLRAFQLVSQHFDSLSKVIVQHGGALVKTIGDAVMAVFLSPADALKASLAMLAAVDSLNRRLASREMILKIGIHSGGAIAVTLNDRLDYFGQTVNIAARVQSLAEADEICFTEEVQLAHGVKELVSSRIRLSERTQIRGMRELLVVHRMCGQQQQAVA